MCMIVQRHVDEMCRYLLSVPTRAISQRVRKSSTVSVSRFLPSIEIKSCSLTSMFWYTNALSESSEGLPDDLSFPTSAQAGRGRSTICSSCRFSGGCSSCWCCRWLSLPPTSMSIALIRSSSVSAFASSGVDCAYDAASLVSARALLVTVRAPLARFARFGDVRAVDSPRWRGCSWLKKLVISS